MKIKPQILLVFLLLCFSLFYVPIFGMPVSADNFLTLRVGLYENSPKIFTDENGDAAGFWPDIIEYIAAEEGWEIEYVPGSWAESLDRLEKNEIDIMPDVAYTEERAELYAFSHETVYVSWSRVYTREEVDIESILDLERRSIAVLRGSVNVEGPEGIKTLVSEFDIDCSFIEVDSYLRVFELVASGEAEAAVVSKDFGHLHAADFNLVETPIIFQPSSLYFAFPKDASLNSYLIALIDSHVRELKADEGSIYYQALENWFGIKPSGGAAIPGWIKWSLIGVGGLALLLGGGVLLFRSRVRARTKELREELAERQLAEEKLRESEARYRAVIEGAHDMIQSVGLDGSIIFVNKAWLDTLGYTEAELSSLNLFDVIHPDSRAHCQELMAEVVSGKPVHGIEAAFLTKDGRKILVEGNAAPRYIGNKVVATQGIFRDITARKQAEEKLRESEKFLDSVIENTPNAIWVSDEKGTIIRMNQALRDLLKIKDEEIIGKYNVLNDAQLIKQGFLPLVKSVFEEGKTVNFTLNYNTAKEKQVELAETTQRVLEIVISAVKNEDGKVIHAICQEKDITEQERAREALRESEAFQSGLLANSPTPINVINPDSSMRYVNPALERLTGYSAEELLWRKAPYPYWPRERRQEIMKGFKKAMRQGGRERVELYQKKDGAKFWVEITSTPVKKDGKLQYLLATWVDITERKQAEEKLADELTRHRILIDQSRDGIVILNEKGKVYEANRRFAEMLGYTPEEVRKLGVWDWEFKYPREQVAEMIRTVDEAGDRFETQHRRKDGTIYDVEISTNGAIYAGQKLIFCVCRDITARKQAEAALRQSEEKLRVILESIPQGVTVTNMDGKILQVNNAGLRLHGYSTRQELIGRGAVELITKEGHARAADNLKKTLETGRSGAVEYTLIRKDGTTFPAQLSAALIQDESAKPIGFVAVTEDITERRNMQEQLVITDRLASVGELAAGIAHELNNPLTGVVGFSQLLMEKEIPEDIKQDVQVVYREAQRAAQVVKNLLTFARKHSAVKERLNINEVINKVMELRAYEQNLENIKVKAHYDSALPEVMADYFQLQQVFLNIVINAEYFMKEAHHKGNLTITTERVGNKIRVSFADDGPGIAKENLGHLFDPFFTTKEVGRGTGLGLSICHGIVAEHGGRIYVESELGKGATFIVELPVGAAERKKGGAL